MKETCEGHTSTLDALDESLRSHKREFLQERLELFVEQEQSRTEREEKSSSYHDVFSTVRSLVLDSTSGSARLEESVCKLQLLYEVSGKVPVSAWPLLQLVEGDLRFR